MPHGGWRPNAKLRLITNILVWVYALTPLIEEWESCPKEKVHCIFHKVLGTGATLLLLAVALVLVHRELVVVPLLFSKRYSYIHSIIAV